MNKGIIKSLVYEHNEVEQLTKRIMKAQIKAQEDIIRKLLIELGYKVEKEKDFIHFAKTRCRIETKTFPDFEDKIIYVDNVPKIRWDTRADIDFSAGKMKSTFTKPKIIG